MPTLRLLLAATVPLLMACQASSTETAPAAATASQVADEADASVIPLDQVQASQSGSVSQTIANTELTITYDRPVARGRALFGGIVPYGEIWNPGANDATAITLSRAVTINGHRLDAGKYSIWAIPGEREWTVIFSRAADVFHQPYPGEEHDALRLTIAPTTGDYVETLAFYFPVVEKKDAELRLHWGETIVPFAITVP
ncbi:MAG: DUF2911 domain-containing protein [Vicinamibacterales bacterium]